ncbi:SAP domain-containing protein [Pseudoalteromonas tetraodonis]|uniref:SAP domain-containing protein n=1 Tax=Pseudoalteromonas tetraodonis TaxID=43659 RepID=UPI003734E98A
MMDTNEYYFLKSFLKPKSLLKMLSMRDWTSYLGRDARLALNKFEKEGVLQLASTQDVVTATHSAPELKKISQNLNLPTSGTKSVLVRRILEVAPNYFNSNLLEHDFLVCSCEGAKQVEVKGKTIKNEMVAAVELSVSEAINRNFKCAFEPVRKYQLSLPFPSGLGVDWSNFGGPREIFIINNILDDWPLILSEIQPDLKPLVRQGAVSMFLWGLKLDDELRKKLASNGTHLDPDGVCRMMLFFAQNKFRIFDAKLKSQELGMPHIMKTMRFEGDFCSACEKHRVGDYSLSEVPEIPLADCRCKGGCVISLSEALDINKITTM